ncbi:MAG: hypothetical protein JWN01_1100 [Patescibacteria group bacterium]|nr:hypothetical protein [Patescibacteria group bacterium]
MANAETENNQPNQPSGPSVDYTALLSLAQQEQTREEPDQPERTPKPPRNLERRRRGLRGRDEAVVETGGPEEQKQLLDVLEDPAHHTRDELLSAVMADYSGEAYGDNQWRKTTGGWGSPEEQTAYGELREKYPQYGQLSLDPGFMTHLPEFMALVESGGITAPDYQGAREQFKAELGTKILYRGTRLTDEELQSVRENGLLSPLSTIIADSDQPQEDFEAVALSAWTGEAVERHFHGEHPATPFLSVSGHEDIATAVGRQYGKRGEERKFYLLKLEVPKIDIVSYREHAVRTPSWLQQLQDRSPDAGVKVDIDGQTVEHKWGDDIESYVFGKINPREIVEITQPAIKESTWNGRKTVE